MQAAPNNFLVFGPVAWLVLYRTVWSRYCNVVVGGHAFEKGNRWGGKKGMGRKGGRSVYSQPGIRADRDSRHDTEEGFPSK